MNDRSSDTPPVTKANDEPGDKPGDGPGDGPDSVFVDDTGPGHFAQTVRAGRHRLISDEPTAYGGEDKGPTPYDLLLAALGSCTAMTIRMYADRKKWPLDRVSVQLRHYKIHAQDGENCETETRRIDRIDRNIALVGPGLTDEQRRRLMIIADRCPVHRTLHSEIEVVTETMEPA